MYDWILCYKVLHGRYDTLLNDLFVNLATPRTCGNEQKLFKNYHAIAVNITKFYKLSGRLLE